MAGCSSLVRLSKRSKRTGCPPHCASPGRPDADRVMVRDARLSVRRGGRVVVVHDGDEHLVCQSLLE